MSKIIASTYEITEQIGAGGGGVVYLARHLRLGKWVVLKADKRTLSTKPEVLRREVDALKNLSHTYIPQVYDFITEEGTVYTVMDHIEGESLDKPLKRGERFEQAKVIGWACQLLEALCYLHSRPPHGILHSDIKPANIMLKPDGDICLIDFNIALALGEEGAVQVGFSRGYASPEHYGVDFAAVGQTQNAEELAKTQLDEQAGATVLGDSVGSAASGSGSASGGRTILLDVRSDIYSLGATLYHLFTGTRPAQKAEEVQPIPKGAVSQAVAAIIAKAMAPDPQDRFQSAEEMLRAFEGLHKGDVRSKRHRIKTVVTAGVFVLAFLAGAATAFLGLKHMERTQNAYALAEYSAGALREGDVSTAISYALEALPEKRTLVDPPYTAQAQLALTNALGIYDMTDGFKPHHVAALSGEPMKLTASASGKHMAVVTLGELSVFDTESGSLLATLPMEKSALADVIFSGDDMLFYAGDGALCAYDLAADKQLWSGGRATAIALSADGSTLAAIYKDDVQALVYDAASGELLKTVDFGGRHQSVATNDSFADPQDNLFAVSGDGRFLAVSFSDGSLWVYDLVESGRDLELYTDSHYTHFEGGFFDRFFAFVSTAEDDSVFAVIDAVAMTQTGGFASTFPFHTQADESGVYVATENILVKIDPVTGEQTELAYTHTDIETFARSESHTLVTTSDGTLSVFDRNARLVDKYEDVERCDFAALAGEYMMTAGGDKPSVRVMKLESNADAQLLTYDPSFVHDEARISADGETVMLFRYDCFRLYAADGTVLTEVEIPDAEQVYDQQYRREEGYLEVFYYDGLIRRYSAKDGSLISEEKGTAPDESLYEEFFTDTLKITSPLHGTPAAYDRQSGELICELEPDAYLTYVTQVGEHIVTEYISVHGDRYALLLDAKCQTLARMPELCDVLPDGTLLFDDMSGNLRQGRIHSLAELMALARG